MKPKTIKVSYPHVDPHTEPGSAYRFRVEQVGESVEFMPTQFLTKAQVE